MKYGAEKKEYKDYIQEFKTAHFGELSSSGSISLAVKEFPTALFHSYKNTVRYFVSRCREMTMHVDFYEKTNERFQGILEFQRGAKFSRAINTRENFVKNNIPYENILLIWRKFPYKEKEILIETITKHEVIQRGYNNQDSQYEQGIDVPVINTVVLKFELDKEINLIPIFTNE